MPKPNDTPSFPPLPVPETRSGDARRVGVEVEFGGLTEGEAASVARARFGGDLGPEKEFSVTLRGSALGDLTFILDTALRAHAGSGLVEAGLELSRGLVPVEVVTEPLPPDRLGDMAALCDDLRAAGAVGTESGRHRGFGIHFNVETVAPDGRETCRAVLAYALIEDWLRRAAPIDGTRRAMPFVDPWPPAFVDALAAEPGADFDRLRRICAEHLSGRNHGLDLLPLLKAADGAAFERMFPDLDAVKARPAFHFRLPDCRIGDPDWSLADEWWRWLMVERLADNADLLDDLRVEWMRRDRALLGDRKAWGRQVAEVIGPTGAALSA